MYLYDTNNTARATAGAELTTRTVVVEIKYFCTKNVVINTENCKLNLPLDCSKTRMEKNIRRMCGIDESSRRRGFAGFALEVFYIDFIEAGCSRKAPFVIRTKDQWEAVKRVSKWAAAYYTHPNSYYKLPTSHVVSLPHIKIPKPTSQKITRNEEAEMRAWAKMHGKSVRKRNVRQDNTMDKVGTLPLNLYETETVLKPVNLNSLIQMRMPVYHQSLPTTNG